MMDQVWHVLAGMAIVTTLCPFIPWWAGIVISMVIAVGRELVQHPVECGEGCRVDVVFWLIGSLAGALICLSFGVR